MDGGDGGIGPDKGLGVRGWVYDGFGRTVIE